MSLVTATARFLVARYTTWMFTPASAMARAMVPTTPLATWKAWLAAQVITQRAPYLSQPFQDAYFELFNKTLNGQQVQRVRWKR